MTRNKPGKYTVLRPTLRVYRCAEPPQYTMIGLTVVLIRELTLCLGKDNYEWLLEFDVSETERVIYRCLA